MIRILIGIGALYAAYRLGKEAGRLENEDVIILPPVDYERRPSERNEAEFGEPI